MKWDQFKKSKIDQKLTESKYEFWGIIQDTIRYCYGDFLKNALKNEVVKREKVDAPIYLKQSHYLGLESSFGQVSLSFCLRNVKVAISPLSRLLVL